MNLFATAVIASLAFQTIGGAVSVCVWQKEPLRAAWNRATRRLPRTETTAVRLAIGPGPAPALDAFATRLLLFRVAAEAAALAAERVHLDERWTNLATVENAVTARETMLGHYEASLGEWATQLGRREEALTAGEADLAEREARFAEAQTPKPFPFDDDIRPLLFEQVAGEHPVSQAPSWNSNSGWYRIYRPGTAEATEDAAAGAR